MWPKALWCLCATPNHQLGKSLISDNGVLDSARYRYRWEWKMWIVLWCLGLGWNHNEISFKHLSKFKIKFTNYKITGSIMFKQACSNCEWNSRVDVMGWKRFLPYWHSVGGIRWLQVHPQPPPLPQKSYVRSFDGCSVRRYPKLTVGKKRSLR